MYYQLRGLAGTQAPPPMPRVTCICGIFHSSIKKFRPGHLISLDTKSLVDIFYVIRDYLYKKNSRTLYGISDYNINHLRRIQNSAAHIVTNTRKYDHITPILQKRHWLPVRQRIHFKILLITYKSINDMAREYLCELVSIRKSSRKLGSSSQILLQVPVSRLKSCGDCAFSVTAHTAGKY